VVQSNTINLHGAREANKLEAQSETCTLAGGNTNTGADSVQDGKYNGGENGERGNFIKRQGALGDKDSSSSNYETFNQILDNAINNFSKSVAHHFLYLIIRKKLVHTLTKKINRFKACWIIIQ
jgi:hypothetical protein